MKEFISETIMEKYEFRNIRPEETDQAIMVEKICFPPNEAVFRQGHERENIKSTRTVPGQRGQKNRKDSRFPEWNSHS